MSKKPTRRETKGKKPSVHQSIIKLRVADYKLGLRIDALEARLPSERDSARSALVAELHRAAVELAESRTAENHRAYEAAKSALAAFDKEQA